MTCDRFTQTVSAGALLVALAGCNDRSQYQPPPVAEVTVQRPIQRKVTLYAEFTGVTAATNKVDLVARVPGFLERVAFKDGDHVKKGDVLFVIEQAPYKASLDLATAAQAQQQAQLTQADADFQRQSTLLQRQAASASTVDDSRGKRDSAAAALEQTKVQVRQAQINLDYTEIKAPFDGIVAARLADPGSFVGSGGVTKLSTIVQVDPVYVNLSINEQQALLVRQQLRSSGRTFASLDPVPAEVGLQIESGFPHHGRIDYVSPTVDTGTGTLSVRVVLDNKDGLLLPGLFARIRVPTQVDIDALVVPDAALSVNQRGYYVLAVGNDNVVALRQIEIGESVEGGWRIVKSGLGVDERVVVAGLQRAIPGARVNVKEAVNPAGARP